MIKKLISQDVAILKAIKMRNFMTPYTTVALHGVHANHVIAINREIFIVRKTWNNQVQDHPMIVMTILTTLTLWRTSPTEIINFVKIEDMIDEEWALNLPPQIVTPLNPMSKSNHIVRDLPLSWINSDTVDILRTMCKTIVVGPAPLLKTLLSPQTVQRLWPHRFRCQTIL